MIYIKSFNLLDLTSQVSRIHVLQSFELKYGQVMTSLQMLWMINTIRYWTCDLWKQVWGNQFPTSQCRIQETTTWSERSPQESPQKEVWKWHHSMLPRFAGVLSLYFSLVSCIKKQHTSHVYCGGLHAFGGHLHLDFLVAPSFPENFGSRKLPMSKNMWNDELQAWVLIPCTS